MSMSSHGDDAITASSSLASVQVGRGSEQRTIGSTRRISGRAGAGRLIGSFIYTPYLFVMHVVFKKHATPRVLRPSLRASSKLSAMHIDTDGVLTVYPIGVRSPGDRGTSRRPPTVSRGSAGSNPSTARSNRMSSSHRSASTPTLNVHEHD